MQTVSDIMHGIITINENEFLRAAAAKMVKNNRGSIIVTDSEDKTIGILTERDILRIVADGYDLKKTRLHGHYTKNIISADENTPLDEAALLMEKHGIRRLAVKRGEKIIGVLTTRSLSKHLKYGLAEKFLSGSYQPKLHTDMEGRNYR
jgi:CBS domain-containing protein